MKKKDKKKLALSKETITNMEDGKLTNIVGGATLDRLCPTRWTCPVTY